MKSKFFKSNIILNPKLFGVPIKLFHVKPIPTKSKTPWIMLFLWVEPKCLISASKVMCQALSPKKNLLWNFLLSIFFFGKFFSRSRFFSDFFLFFGKFFFGKYFLTIFFGWAFFRQKFYLVKDFFWHFFLQKWFWQKKIFAKFCLSKFFGVQFF